MGEAPPFLPPPPPLQQQVLEASECLLEPGVSLISLFLQQDMGL